MPLHMSKNEDVIFSPRHKTILKNPDIKTVSKMKCQSEKCPGRYADPSQSAVHGRKAEQQRTQPRLHCADHFEYYE